MVQDGIALEVVRVHTSRAQVARVEELQELLEVAQGANAAVLDAACVEAGNITRGARQPPDARAGGTLRCTCRRSEECSVPS